MGQFIGPPLAGVLIALAVPAPFILDALTFAVAALAVAAMQVRARCLAPVPFFDPGAGNSLSQHV